MSRSLMDNPEFWRSRAEEVRTIAEELRDPDAKVIMNRIANDYARLAQHALERSMSEQSSLR